MRTEKKRPVLKFFSESLMIVISVLFALFLNEWRNNYNEEQRTLKLLENLKTEISANLSVLEKLVPYHEMVADKIAIAYDSSRLEEYFFNSYYFQTKHVAPKGIIQSNLYDIAWTVAKQDGISNRIDWEQTKTFSELYDQQILVNQTIDRIYIIISSREAQRKELLNETVLVFEDEILELIGQEKNLLSFYKKALKALSEEKSN